MFFSRLFESMQSVEGDRHFEGALGVYLYKDGTPKTAEYYMRFVQLAKGLPVVCD